MIWESLCWPSHELILPNMPASDRLVTSVLNWIRSFTASQWSSFNPGAFFPTSDSFFPSNSDQVHGTISAGVESAADCWPFFRSSFIFTNSAARFPHHNFILLRQNNEQHQRVSVIYFRSISQYRCFDQSLIVLCASLRHGVRCMERHPSVDQSELCRTSCLNSWNSPQFRDHFVMFLNPLVSVSWL